MVEKSYLYYYTPDKLVYFDELAKRINVSGGRELPDETDFDSLFFWNENNGINLYDGSPIIWVNIMNSLDPVDRASVGRAIGLTNRGLTKQLRVRKPTLGHLRAIEDVKMLSRYCRIAYPRALFVVSCFNNK